MSSAIPNRPIPRGRVSGAAILLSDSELDCNPVVRNARSQVRVPLEGLPDPYPAVCNNALKLLACSFVVKLDEAECPNAGHGVFYGIDRQLGNCLTYKRVEIGNPQTGLRQGFNNSVGQAFSLRLVIEPGQGKNYLRAMPHGNVPIIYVNAALSENLEHSQRIEVRAHEEALRHQNSTFHPNLPRKERVHDTPKRSRWTNELAPAQVHLHR